MSYEGYDQMLCANGHLTSYSSYEDYKHLCEKKDCGAPFVWTNNVDQTNGCMHEESDYRGCCPVKLEVKTPAVFETCKCCGHSVLKVEETYKIPVDVGRMIKPNQAHFDPREDCGCLHQGEHAKGCPRIAAIEKPKAAPFNTCCGLYASDGIDHAGDCREKY